MVWRGGDPRPVPLIPAVAGLTAVGTLMDEDEDAEEKRRRMEAKIAALGYGKYYTDKEVLYLCIRDSGIGMAFDLENLVSGGYVQVVENK